MRSSSALTESVNEKEAPDRNPVYSSLEEHCYVMSEE